MDKSLRVVLLSPSNSIHTIRWANGLSDIGIEVHVVSLHSPVTQQYNSGVRLHQLSAKLPLGYFTAYKELRNILVDIKPDILNAHFATGYGTLARLSGFQPLLLSVWGSDVYDFPTKSFIHKFLLRRNLENAIAIASTSYCMAEQVKETYQHPHIFITPFGIDEKLFYEKQVYNHNDGLRIGTVKTLEDKYGIDTLVKAFSLAKSKTDKAISLDIYGSGKAKDSLIALVKSLNIEDSVNFHGSISHHLVPKALNSLDVYVALSRSESFGVAILEASSCGLPVIVSSIGGLKEVVVQDETGIIVAKDDPEQASNAILKLIKSTELRKRLGREGRKRVEDLYSWSNSLKLMEQAYLNTIDLYNPTINDK